MRWLLLLLLLPAAGAEALIVAVAPDLPGEASGEGIAVWSDTGLAAVSLTDGEATWRVPDVGPGTHWFVSDSGAWAAFDGPAPAAQWDGLRLGNDGDDIHLLDASGDVMDHFLYGDKTDAGWGRLGSRAQGLVYHRLADGHGFLDTDTAADWRTPREHRIGESAIPRRSFTADEAWLYASPDNSFAFLTGLMDAAVDRLHLHVYELRSRELTDRLVAAAERGVDVQVLVTRYPVGQDDLDRMQTADALQRIEAAGGAAWLAERGRYNFHHLKVLLADDVTAVQSENWVASGVPGDPSWGNRGWGAAVASAAMADWFADWMADDRAAWDATPFDLAAYAPDFDPPPRFSTRSAGYDGRMPVLRLAGPVAVTPVITPEHTQDPAMDPVAAVAKDAHERLWVQQLDLSRGGSNALGWSGDDALHGAVAASRAADVRVMAAAPFRYDDTGNMEAIAALPGHVQTCTFAVPDLILHNKGVIADDAVYVGSMNGNHHSRAQNREVGLIIEDVRAADHFERLFLADWEHCPEAELVVPFPVPTLFLLALAAWLRRCSSPA